MPGSYRYVPIKAGIETIYKDEVGIRPSLLTIRSKSSSFGTLSLSNLQLASASPGDIGIVFIDEVGYKRNLADNSYWNQAGYWAQYLREEVLRLNRSGENYDFVTVKNFYKLKCMRAHSVIDDRSFKSDEFIREIEDALADG